MSPEERKQVVRDFLRRCVTYSDASIERKLERNEDREEITRWKAYREFTAYAISEIDDGTLDSWFDSEASEQVSQPCVGKTPAEVNVDRDWLSALVSPRPVALLSTTSSTGIDNLCAITSHSVLANRPPLIGLSLSIDQDGKQRDSLLNLQEGSGAILAILPATWEATHLVQAAAKSLPRDGSEWDSLEDEKIEVEGGLPYPKSSLALIECELVEARPLPAGSVATLVILQVKRLLVPDELADGLDLNRLGPLMSQHGSMRVTSGPDPSSWSRTIE